MPKELFAQPHHLALGALQAEINLTDDVITRAAQFGGGRRRLGQTTQFAQDQLECSEHIIRVEPGGNHQIAGVIEKAERAVDIISQAAVLAHDLKEPRTHVLADERVEQAQNKAALVVA